MDIKKIFEQLEENGKLSVLVKSGIISPTHLLHFEIYKEISKRDNSKGNKIRTKKDVADLFNVSIVTVYTACSKFGNT